MKNYIKRPVVATQALTTYHLTEGTTIVLRRVSKKVLLTVGRGWLLY
jgi:hypothetical protein